jgi:hypothetical protein
MRHPEAFHRYSPPALATFPSGTPPPQPQPLTLPLESGTVAVVALYGSVAVEEALVHPPTVDGLTWRAETTDAKGGTRQPVQLGDGGDALFAHGPAQPVARVLVRGPCVLRWFPVFGEGLAPNLRSATYWLRALVLDAETPPAQLAHHLGVDL